MPKTKNVDEVKEVSKENLCESCLEKGRKVVMSRSGNNYECTKCFAWKPIKPVSEETKEEKKARLLAELKKMDEVE